MKRLKIISIGALLLLLTVAGAFIAYKVSEGARCSLRQDVIVLWNNSSKPIDVELRFSRLTPKYLEVAQGARACVPLVTDKKFKSWDDLRYIEVGYGKKKYKFTKEGCLNTSELCEGGRSARYFMVADLTVNDEVWERVKKKYEEKDKTLDEDYKYLILSNYGKKESPWGAKAQIQAVQSKRIKPSS
jgi:hypothetical protein